MVVSTTGAGGIPSGVATDGSEPVVGSVGGAPGVFPVFRHPVAAPVSPSRTASTTTRMIVTPGAVRSIP